MDGGKLKLKKSDNFSIKSKYITEVNAILNQYGNHDKSEFICQAILEKYERDTAKKEKTFVEQPVQDPYSANPQVNNGYGYIPNPYGYGIPQIMPKPEEIDKIIEEKVSTAMSSVINQQMQQFETMFQSFQQQITTIASTPSNEAQAGRTESATGLSATKGNETKENLEQSKDNTDNPPQDQNEHLKQDDSPENLSDSKGEGEKAKTDIQADDASTENANSENDNQTPDAQEIKENDGKPKETDIKKTDTTEDDTSAVPDNSEQVKNDVQKPVTIKKKRTSGKKRERRINNAVKTDQVIG